MSTMPQPAPTSTATDRGAAPPGTPPGLDAGEAALQRFALFRTSDPEEAAARGARFLSRHRVIPREPGCFDARFHATTLGRLGLYRVSYGGEVEIVAPATEDWVAVVVPRRGRLTLTFGDITDNAEPGDVLVVPADRAIRMRWSAAFTGICLRVDRGAIQERAGRYVIGRTGTIRFLPGRTPSPTTGALAGGVELLLELLRQHGSAAALPTTMVADLEAQFLTTLLLAHPHTLTHQITSSLPVGCTAATQRAAELMRRSPTGCGSVTEIAAEVGVSARSLQAGFRRQFGVSPREYLKQVRLDAARRDIESTGSGTGTVLGIASSWGFANAGRFARDYRDRFGHLPSAGARRRDGPRHA